MDSLEIWKKVLGNLETSISRPNFVTWFKDTFIYEAKKGIYTIGVPSIFHSERLKKWHEKEIIKAIEDQTGDKVLGLKYKVASPSADQVIKFDNFKVIHSPVDKPEKKTSQNISSQTLPKNTTLNDYYVFENFVVGTSNQLAHAAAEAVANSPGDAYNPLFIYGDSGLGKTHLMQAIGNHILSKNEDANILYVSSETFVNDFIAAVEAGSGRAKDFKKHYRDVDILLIDDIQFLSGKEQTQDEFFHTFNHLHQNKKQVVLTADRYPKAIRGLEKRLQTRFEGGMVADISEPDLETRAVILRNKTKSTNVEISDEVIYFIAENIKSSVRELEGALTKLIATSELRKTTPDIEFAREILESSLEKNQKSLTYDVIIKEACKYYKIPKEDVLGQKRNKEIVRPRQVVMFLLRHEINMSYPEIGKEMGGRDHTTVMHGCEKMEIEIPKDSKLKDDISTIKDILRNAIT